MIDTSKVTRIEVIDEKGRSYVHFNSNNKVELSLQDEDKTLKVIVKQEKSAETIANEMGFKIGDRIWFVGTKEYHGKITKFLFMDNDLYCETDTIYPGSTEGINVILSGDGDDEYVTNKASVQVKSKEESVFISKLLDTKDLWTDYTASLVYNINRPNLAIDVDITFSSIGDYLEGIGQEPVLITEDKVKIWNPDQIVYRTWSGFIYPDKVEDILNDPYTNQCIFSTEQIAKDYLESLKAKFEVNKWYYHTEYGFHALFGVIGNESPVSFVGFSGLEWSETVTSKEQMENPDKFGKWTKANDAKIKQLLLKECIHRFPIGTKFKRMNRPEVIFTITKEPYFIGDTIHTNTPQSEWSSNYLGGQSNPTLFKDGKFAEIIEQPKIIRWLADSVQVMKLELDADDYVTKIADPKGKIFDNEREAWLYFFEITDKDIHALLQIKLNEGIISMMEFLKYAYINKNYKQPKTIEDKPCNTCKYTGFAMDEEPCVTCITQTTEFRHYVKSK